MNLKIIAINPAKKAILFIKPTVTVNEKAITKAWALLDKYGIKKITEPKTFIGAEIDAQQLIQRHYGAHYQNTIKKPSEFALNDADRLRFLKTFGLSFEEAIKQNKIKSGYGFMEEFSLSAIALNDLWTQSKNVTKIAGVRFGTIKHNNIDYIVTNAFIPKLLEVFTMPNASILLTEVSFSGTWQSFRAKLMEIRNELKALSNEYGIIIDGMNNGLHASASPFEAMLERWIWNDPTKNTHFLKTDVFGKQLIEKGISLETILAWSKCPFIQYQGNLTPLFDTIEDKDPDEAIRILLEIQAENKTVR